MTVAGSPDFISQVGDTNSFLATYAVDTSAPTQHDITALIDPSMQALAFVFLPAFPPLIAQVALSFGTTPGGAYIPDQLNCQSYIPQILPLDSQLVAQGVITQLRLNVAGVTGDPAGTGTLHVWAVTYLPHVYNVDKWVLGGVGNTTGTIACAAFANTQVMAAPPLGTFAKVKLLTWRATAVAAGASFLQWNGGVGATEFFQIQVAAGGAQFGTQVMDWRTRNGIILANNTSALYGATVLYELWPI